MWVVIGLQTACDHSSASAPNDCGGQLALVGDVPLSTDELASFVGETAAAGQRLPQDRALRDLVWQEAERQRLALPGGADLRKSRRAAIRAIGVTVRRVSESRWKWMRCQTAFCLPHVGRVCFTAPTRLGSDRSS